MLRPSSRALVATVLTGLLQACGAGASQEGAPVERRPNVVLILVDTLRADRMSCYGYPRATTPALDAFAASGVRFADATAQAAWTLPSVASLMTGRYVHASRSEAAAEGPVLPELFRQAGYRTIAVVGNPLLRQGKPGWARGFDHFVGLKADHQEEDTPAGPGVERLMREVVLKLDQLRDRPYRPLFLWVLPYYPHGPYLHHAELDLELPLEESAPVHPEGWWNEVLADLELRPPDDDPGWERELESLREMRGMYDQEVRYTDRFVERLTQEMRARGFYEDTIFAFASDHGEGLWQHETYRAGEDALAGPGDVFYRRHGMHLYEESIRTPLFVWGAGVPGGVVVGEPVENIDLFPTLLELAGLSVPPGVHGTSQVGRMHGARIEPRPFVFSNSRFAASVRELASGFKLTLPNDGGRSANHEVELYHLPTDPHERTNLRDEHPAEVQRLATVLEGWLAAHALADEGEIDPEQWEEMQGLGYTADDVGR